MLGLAPDPDTSIAIVGGCGGIGRALVAAAVELELRVVVLDLPGAIMATRPNVPTVDVNVMSTASVEAAFARIPGIVGPLHAVVNLAGFARERTPLGELDEDAWSEVINANLSGAWRVARAALPFLRAAATPQAPTSLVHAASGLAARLLPGYGPYGAAKAGLIALTKALALENAPLVRANAVAPGAVRTEFLQGGLGRPEVAGRLDEAAYVRAVPMGRIAEAEDIAGPILFLCAPAAGFMTGQTLWINGGMLTP